MGATPVFFNGRLLVSPQAAVRVDDTQLAAVRIRGNEALGIVGESEGGEPQKILFFQDPSDARDTLRSGRLLDAIERAYDPSPQLPGAFTVAAIRVNKATQATLDLDDSGATAVLNLTSDDYGIHTNFTEVKVEAGTVAGKKVSVRKNNFIASKDNLFKESFTLKHTGATTSAVVDISWNATPTAHRELVTTIDASVDLTIDLSGFKSIRDLVNFFNAQTGYTATAKTLTQDDDDPSDLDHAVATDIKDVDGSITATLSTIVEWFNSDENPFVNATRVLIEGTLPVNIPFTFLTGAVEGTPTTNQDWQDAFDVLGTADVPIFVSVTGNESIHAAGDTHAQFASSSGRAERVQIVGSDLGDNAVSALLTRAQGLNSDRSMLIAQGVEDFDRFGRPVIIPAYVMAAALGGMFIGSETGLPMTHKFVKARGLEKEYTGAEQDQLLEGGVAPFQFVQGRGFWLVQSLTTWNINSNFNRTEVSVQLAVDMIRRNVRRVLDEELVGSKGTPETLNRAVSLTQSVLEGLANEEIIVGNALNPPFKNITARLQKDIIFVTFEASPVLPVNFVLVTVHAVPFSGIVTAATVNA